MVVLVRVDALHSVVLLEVVLSQQFKDFVVDRDLRETNKDPSCNLLDCDLVEPRVFSDICNLESLFRVRIQKVGYEIPRLWRNKFRDLVVSVEDLLVKIRRVWIFEGQVPTDQSKQDDSTAPNVNIRSMISLASNHLRSSIAGRATSSFQSLPSFISVRQPKIDYLYILLVVE